MKVSATIEGVNMTIVDINVNGLDIYMTYVNPSDGYLKVRKYPRNQLLSATTLGTNAASLE